MASSVSIVSATGPDGGRAAMTATSVTSLSLDPPSMLVCVNRNAWLYQTLRLGGDFCINVLGADQIAMAQSCGGKSQGDARFAQGWGDEMGVPVLIGAPSAIVCGQVTRLALGTHDVIVGHVKRVLVDDAQVDPLLYVSGA
ncbi:MAG: flavin reductase family protein [Sphingomonadales bacterium]|nr:flavin reductase family protein [Sphingomonadales bacterium]